MPFIVISITPLCEETLAHITVYLYTHSQSKKCAYYSSKVQLSKLSSKFRQRSNKKNSCFYALLLGFQQIIIIIEHIQSLICMHMYLFIYLRSNEVIIAIINNTVTQYEYNYLYNVF